MLRHALNAAISIDSGAPQAHELLLANESASRIGPVTGRPQGIAPTMLRLRKPVHAWWQRNVSFPSPGHFTLCVIRQQSLYCVGFCGSSSISLAFLILLKV